MKILEEAGKNFVNFDVLEVGEVFKHEGSLFMKIKPFDTIDSNDCVEPVQAVSLANGDLYNFFSTDDVEWLDKARLVLR